MTTPDAAGVPALEARLPDLVRFVQDLQRAHALGDLASWDDLADRCGVFYTEPRMRLIDEVVPGWREMASYADGLTLHHTTAALVSLVGLPEYKAATTGQRHLAEWIVLLHDLAKIVEPGKRDPVHPFRSAARAAVGLPGIGFGVTDAWRHEFQRWHAETASAYRVDPEAGGHVLDNSKLPGIIAGIDRCFGPEAALVIKAILLHASITVVQEWPVAAPLTAAEEREYVDVDLRPLLEMMMLADSGGWEMFNPDTLALMYRETRAVFSRL